MYENETQAIKKDDVSFFLNKQLSEKQKDLFLSFAVQLNKQKLIKHFVLDGAKLTNLMSLDNLTSKKNSLKIFQFLESHGYDLKQRGEILMFKSALSCNVKLTEFLVEKTEFNSSAVKITYLNICALLNTKNKQGDQNLLKILNIFNTKIDLNSIEEQIKKSLLKKEDLILEIKRNFLTVNFRKEEGGFSRSKNLKI